jgi:NADH dehydrogenase FAD-containing subunit
MARQDRVTVVIIGASFAGFGVINGLLKGLSNRVKVVLINPSDKWYFNIAAPRIFAKPSAFNPDQYLIPFAKSLSRYGKESFEFIKGSATHIDIAAKKVIVSAQGQISVSYDYLVIASGSSTTSLTTGLPVPFKPTGADDLEDSVSKAQDAIAKAKSIIIGGAGPIGVEFAGELAEAWNGRTNTSITLVSASKRVLPMLKQSAGQAAEKLLAKHNVKVVRGHRVVDAFQQTDGQKQWIVSLENGEKLMADVYVSSTGVTPNSQFVPGEYLSSEGWVNVDKNFRVGSQPIYAVGDVTTHPIRTSLKVAEQIPVVVSNLKADIAGSSKRVAYAPNMKMMMLVPVGSSSGTGQMMGMVPWGKMVAMIKGKDFFVSKARSLVGLA